MITSLSNLRADSKGVGALLALVLLMGAPMNLSLAQETAIAEESSEPESDPKASGEEVPEEASGAPIGLFGPLPAEPDESESAGSSILSLPSAPGTQNGVDVGLLSAVDNRSLGLISDNDGGFGTAMWSGTRRSIVEDLILELPNRTGSAIMRSLTRRLLLTRANDPSGEPDGASILALRLAKLYDAGFIDEALALSRQDLATTVQADVLKVGSKIHLLHGDAQSACGNAARTRSIGDDAFWLKLRAVCYVLAKDPASARMSAELLIDDNHDDPAYFSLLWNAIDDIGLPVEHIDKAGALHLMLLKMNHLSLPAGSVGSAIVPVQMRVAETGVAGGAPADLLTVRLPAAEQAVHAGAFAAQRLGVLYREAGIGAAELPGIISRAYEDPSVRTRAALYQAVEAARGTAERARLIKIGLDVGAMSGTSDIARLVYGRALEQLTPDETLGAYASSFVPVLIAGEAYDAAALWLDVLNARQQAAGSAGPSDDGLAYGAMLQLIRPYEERGYTWDALGRLTLARSDHDYYRAALEVRLFDGLGMSVPEEAKLQLLARPMEAGGQMPKSGVLSGLDAAARSGRVGETVLYALVALGPEGPGEAPASVLVKVVSGLNRVGLREEAKRVAIESLLGAS